LQKRPLSFSYIVFFLLFWPDTYRILAGIAAAFFISPRIIPPDLSFFGTGMFYFMIACIGYSVSAPLSRRIVRLLKKWILGKKLPS
jgi:hypothetical protein